MSRRPGVGRSTPVESEKEKSGTGDEKDTSDGVDGPEELLLGELGVDARRRLVDEEESEGGGSVECGLEVEDIPLCRWRRE